MSQQFSRFDEVSIGASLALSFGDQILQTSANVDAHRLARSTIALALWPGYVECYLYSPSGANPSLASVAGVPPATIGVVTASASLSNYVGADTNGYGWCPGDGKVYNNWSVIATFSPAAYNTYPGVSLDPVAGLLTFTVNGQPIGSVNVPTGQTWYYAASVSGNPGDIAWWANSGQTLQRFFDQKSGGWWQPSPTINPILVATEPFLTQSTDANPNIKYNGDVDRQNQPPKIERSVSVWTWGASAPPMMNSSSTQGQMRILDPDHLYDALIT